MRLGIPLIAGAALTLAVLGPASANTQLGPKYGGVLVIGLSGGDVDTLDPTVARSSATLSINRVLCQRLYDLNDNLQLVPVLAAALPVISKDKLSYTVQLRKGVEFNDGTPLNAQAVVTTVQRFMTYPGSIRANDYASVDTVTVAGPYTVVYHMKVRDSTFTSGQLYVLSPTQLDKLGSNFASDPICVGPFMFDHRVPGDNVTVIKSPYYYDQQHVYLDKIVYKPMPDAAAAVAALEAGDIQALDNVSPTDLAGVRQTSRLQVIQHYQLGWNGIIINVGNKNGLGKLPYAPVGSPLASSPKLRLAFEEAIDRNTMNRVVFGGLYQTSCTPIAPADTPWFDATKVPCTPYDPNDAKKLIASSGFSNPTVHLLVTNTTDNLSLAQFIQAEEAAVGINVVIDVPDAATATARETAGTFDTALGGFTPGNPDPNQNIYGALTTTGVRNYGGYSSPRLDLILNNGVKAMSTQARSTLYHVGQQIIENDRPVIVLYNANRFAAFSTNLTGVKLEYNGRLAIANAWFK